MSFVKDKGTSNRIDKLTLKRNNKVTDYLHKTSRFIINYCIENKIGNIVIGNNKDWKQEVNLGKRNNQNFVSIPYEKLIQQIQYKAELVGIKVIITEESYTSKVDHLANEELCKHETYLGKRIKRGLFQSSIKKLINADVNGAIGILRKEFSNFDFNQITNRGLAFNPVKINLF
jgi:putative transposase